MPRDVTDSSGTVWTCIQAFAGVGADAEKTEAARVDGSPNCVHVVCTPSGGAKSVRVESREDWEREVSDEQWLRVIQAGLAQNQ
jgi:hypothetical protein